MGSGKIYATICAASCQRTLGVCFLWRYTAFASNWGTDSPRIAADFEVSICQRSQGLLFHSGTQMHRGERRAMGCLTAAYTRNVRCENFLYLGDAIVDDLLILCLWK